MGRIAGSLACLATFLLSVGCARLVPSVAPPAPVLLAASAVTSPLGRGPGIGSLKLSSADAGPALASFVESCPRLLARKDDSGLTRPADWADACAAASRWEYGKARQFFETWFETVRVGTGAAHVTGYYEPELAGSRNRRGIFATPVYKLPAGLVRGWPDVVPPDERRGEPLIGRYDASGKFARFFDRAEIDAGALAGEGLEVAWVADPAAYYFMQVQGSGRIRTPEGEIIHLRYAGKNGHPYTSIGAVMRGRGLIGNGPGQYAGSMQGIMQYLRDQPEQGRALMRENRSWVFFREAPGEGPIGSLGIEVQALSSIAADPAFVPLGAPVFLTLDDPRADGLWIAQDTGGAIRGANRFDSFWGFGDEAGAIAGTMSARGQALLLLPRGTLRRLSIR